MSKKYVSIPSNLLDVEALTSKEEYYDSIGKCCSLIDKGVLMTKEDMEEVIKNMLSAYDYKVRQ